MNRIEQTFAELRALGKKILSPYITAGDPEPGFTVSLLHALTEAGANILELGIPFSDPMAEGPVIQAAMERALAHNITTDDVFGMVEEFRAKDEKTPIVLMGYANPIEQYGYERFANRALEVGVDGVILVDLPPEESAEILPFFRATNVYMIYLCSPTTSMLRMESIKQKARGYLYYVSLSGVTGADLNLLEVKKQYKVRKAQSSLPVMVGFGIKTPAMAASVAEFADGVIVGAALVNQIFAAYRDGKDAIMAGSTLIREMRNAMDLSGCIS